MKIIRHIGVKRDIERRKEIIIQLIK